MAGFAKEQQMDTSAPAKIMLLEKTVRVSTFMYPLHIQTPMQSSNAREVMIEIGQIYDIFIVLAKSDEPHIYNTYINTSTQLVCRPQLSC